MTSHAPPPTSSIEALLTAAHDWALAKAAPLLAFVPDPWKSYAVIGATALILTASAITFWKKGREVWEVFTWLPRELYRKATGYQPPTDPADIAAAANDRIEKKIDLLLRQQISEQAGDTREAGTDLPEDTVERAVAAAQEVLSSNDPAKEDAQNALRRGDIPAAEKALAEAFEREKAAWLRMDDQTEQLKVKAARTAREKAALAAPRSAAEAVQWYCEAADLAADDFWTWIELARLHTICGTLLDAAKAAKAALNTATDDRERSISNNEFGDVQVAQGDQLGALQSFKASMAIAERLAEADPSNAGLQRDLSVSHEKIGDLMERMGDMARAVEYYERSRVIAAALAERFPDHRQFQSDLRITDRRLGELRAKM
jgi:tetratricopeptide (TPR) repeat protein